MVGWHHLLNGHESEKTPGDREGQGSLVCCSPWGHKESDTTEVTQQQQQQDTDLTSYIKISSKWDPDLKLKLLLNPQNFIDYTGKKIFGTSGEVKISQTRHHDKLDYNKNSVFLCYKEHKNNSTPSVFYAVCKLFRNGTDLFANIHIILFNFRRFSASRMLSSAGQKASSSI